MNDLARWRFFSRIRAREDFVMSLIYSSIIVFDCVKVTEAGLIGDNRLFSLSQSTQSLCLFARHLFIHKTFPNITNLPKDLL